MRIQLVSGPVLRSSAFGPKSGRCDYGLRPSAFVLQTCLCLTCGLTLVCATPLAAQGAKPSAPPKAAVKMITLSGCVERGETPPGQFTLSDREDGSTYRLTGTDVRQYIGRRVQIVGGVASRRFRIVGGLTPNANVAAQAGAMDPVRAATAAAGGAAGPGTVELPEFKVKSVRPVSGSCAG